MARLLARQWWTSAASGGAARPLAALLLGAGLAWAGVSVAAAEAAAGPSLRVVTTIFPLYDFARTVGDGRVEVSLLLPPGTEAHTFDPRPSDLARISHADLFLYTGGSMEPWADKVLGGLGEDTKVRVVDAFRGIRWLTGEDEAEAGGEHGHGHEAGATEHTGRDPHAWLDFTNAQTMVDTVAAALAERDPAGQAVYAANAATLKAKLADLDRRYRETLAGCRLRTLVYGGHFAFGYLAARYGLEHVSPYRGFAPNAEPSPRSIAALIRTLRKLGARHVFHEELVDPKVARVIAEETGATLLLLHGAHNVSRTDLDSGVTFVDLMEANLVRLARGLQHP